MNTAILFAPCGAILLGLGLYGLVTDPDPLRKILAFNLLGSGVFLTFGFISRRAAIAGFDSDPVPQAMTITAIVVAFAATAMAVALISRLAKEARHAARISKSRGGAGSDESSL